MAYILPEKLRKLAPYAPLSGQYQIRLDANESFLEPPDWLREKLGEAVRGVAFNRYPDPYCVELCERFGAFFGVDPALAMAGNGSDELISLIVSSFTGPRDTMAVVRPDFSMYSFYAQMNGVRLAVFEKENLALDADALIAFVREQGAKLLILSNPCNPTSLSASRADILRIVESLDGCLVVVDEAYMDFSEGSILREAGRFENLIVLKTCSKAFGMAAIRLGFTVAGPALTNALKAAKSPYNVNSMTQAVGCAVLGEQGYLRGCIGRIKESRDSLYQQVSALARQKSDPVQVVNSCANFVFLKVSAPQAVFERMGERGIAIRCMPPFLRISAGTPAENAAVCAALDEILN